MSMASSYNLLSWAPPLGKISRAPMRPGKQHAAASVALPRVLRKQSRAPLFVCHAQKYTYNIQPLALVHPKFPPTSHDHWSITEDADRINLWFFVDRSATKDKLEVAMENDVLLVKYAGDSKEDNPASLLDVRLLIPPGYDHNKVEAELKFGSLLVTVTKPPKMRASNKIPIVDKPSTPQ